MLHSFPSSTAASQPNDSSANSWTVYSWQNIVLQGPCVCDATLSVNEWVFEDTNPNLDATFRASNIHKDSSQYKRKEVNKLR